jgi:hypothetical protein
MGGQSYHYWYNGYIFTAQEIARGVDVFRLVPNQYLTQERDRRLQPGAASTN